MPQPVEGVGPGLFVVFAVGEKHDGPTLGAFGLAAQIVLGQRRPLVGPLVLGAHQDQVPIKPRCAEFLCGLGAGKARTDDHECPLAHRVLPPIEFMTT